MDKVIRIELIMAANGSYAVAITKTFTEEHAILTSPPENGGPQVHRALDVAREMVTFTPANVKTAEARGWVHCEDQITSVTA